MKRVLCKLLPLLLALLLAAGTAGCSFVRVERAVNALKEAAELVDAITEDPQSDSAAGDSLSDGGVSAAQTPGSDKESRVEGEPLVKEDGAYTSKEEVAQYLALYGHLPQNFITKEEARKLGWNGGSLEPYAPGKSIGGDRFGNREGLLPSARGRQYYECDIDTMGADSRGGKRIVWSNDGLIYYTDDHYESFTLLYGEE